MVFNLSLYFPFLFPFTAVFLSRICWTMLYVSKRLFPLSFVFQKRLHVFHHFRTIAYSEFFSSFSPFDVFVWRVGDVYGRLLSYRRIFLRYGGMYVSMSLMCSHVIYNATE